MAWDFGSNSEIEKSLEVLPDQVGDALEKWGIAKLDREKTEALLYATYKGYGPDRTATEIKALVNADQGRYDACLTEIKAEANHTRLYEKLMCIKKLCDLRKAF